MTFYYSKIGEPGVVDAGFSYFVRKNPIFTYVFIKNRVYGKLFYGSE
jgi:hypothetical protein